MRRDTRLVVPSILLMGLSGVLAIEGAPAQAADKLDRTVLPIPEPKRPPITEIDVRKATAPPRFEVKAPAGAAALENLDQRHDEMVRRLDGSYQIPK